MPAGERGLRVVACAKAVPDPDATVRFDPLTHRLVRDGQPVLDKIDAVAVSAALGLIEAAGGGEVVLASMGPGASMPALRQGLALGADRAVLVSDPRLAGADALGTARVLAAVVTREAAADPVDVVVTGTVSSDGYSRVIAAMVAELLGWPVVTAIRRVGATLERETDAGSDEVAFSTPCVLSVLGMAAPPRYPSYRAIVGARSKPVELADLAALGLEPPGVGQEVLSIEPVPARPAGEVVEDDGLAHERIVEFLVALGVV